ncbi:flavodoxin [Glaciecola sp. MH2013]|uniref:DnaT-like ssDNA-binding domain-containing protein n=1 Tax=Glaciecola sp. MH2013 TaxID=2785524 RepID=UPI0018A047E6|nr:DnaT-like ssDNA-binding domain-containing protein [Glaciecola sp. MH2013]MBF7074648.1 flavodoxin [Glaciecola sp. MH2013]
MNSLELDALQLPLSNHARALYCVYLSPKSDAKTGEINLLYKDVMAFLNSKEPIVELGRQVNSLLKELANVGLVSIKERSSFKLSLNQHLITLPLKITDEPKVIIDEHHQGFGKMTVDWHPDPTLFNQLCQLVGVIDKGYSADELGEYIAYWLGYPEKQFSQYQWTQKFVLNIKLRRQRQPVSKEQTKVGHQWITPEAGLEVDDNVKKLVEKYSGKQ